MTNNSKIYIDIFEITQNMVVKNKPLILSGLFIWETHIYLCVCVSVCIHVSIPPEMNLEKRIWIDVLNLTVYYLSVM